jgi:hypothetical protein
VLSFAAESDDVSADAVIQRLLDENLPRRP